MGKMCILMLILTVFLILSALNLATAIASWLPGKKYKPYFPKVSVIIRSWNDGSVIGRLIKMLLEQDYPKNRYQIIIVDDGSVDNTKELCGKYARKGKIVYVRWEKHVEHKAEIVDFAVGKHATGEIILEADADSVVQRNWISEMVKPFAEKNVVGVSGTAMCGNWYRNFITKIRAIEDFWHFCISFYGRFKISGQGFLYGSNKAYRKNFWKRIGGHPDKTLVEDAELAIKIIDKGYKIVNITSVPNLQEEVETFSQFLEERRRWVKGDLDIARIYSKEMRTNLVQYILMDANFGWDGVLLFSEILFFINPLFGLPLLLSLLTLWIGFAKLKAKPEFYFYAIPYLIAGPWMQAIAVSSILNTVRKKQKVRWTKVWHYPTRLIKPVD